MPDEVLIVEIENILAEVIRLGGQSERTHIVPNLAVTDASPSGLTGFVIVSDNRDGDNILAKKVPSVIYSNSDTVNVIFPEGGEAIAFQQGSQSAGGSIWELVPGTSTDIFFDKGDVAIGKAVASDAALEILDTAQAQLRLTFEEDTKFVDFTLDTNHHLTIDPSSTGQIKLNADVTVTNLISHEGDPDTNLAFTDDKFSLTVGGLLMIEAIEIAGQDTLDLGDVGGGGDVDIDFNDGQMELRGNDGLLTHDGIVLLTKGGGGSTGPQINLESTSAGAVDSEFAFVAAGVGSTTDVQGPSLGMRGNNFTRAANQRGRLFFNAGDVSTPIGSDGAITFTAYNFHKFLLDTTEMMEIISTGVGINTTPNAAVKLQVKLATNQNIIFSDASGESRISAINDAFSAFVDLAIIGDPLIFRGASAVETARLTTSAFDLATAFFEKDEITAPGAGAVNTTRTYAEDSGGTTREQIIFNGGHTVTIAQDGGLQTYTPTNVVTDRSYDANATSVEELADVLGTLIADFQAAGVLG